MKQTPAVRSRGGVAEAPKSRRKASPVVRVELPPADLSQLPCVTTADRIARIQAVGRKVEEHIREVTASGALAGTSAESRDRAVSLFMERLVFLERALGQTLEDLRLG